MEPKLRIVKKESPTDDLAYWQSKTLAERVAAVTLLNRQYYACLGYTEEPRLKKVITMRKLHAAE